VQDITNSMLEFKEAIRHAWNTYFALLCESPMSPDIQMAFSQIERGLFSAIVLNPLGMTERVVEYRKKSLSWILVTPFDYLDTYPVQFGTRDSSGNIIWSLPTSIAVDDNRTFEFFDFFDWYPYGFIDLSYIRAQVNPSTDQSNTQGSLVLIKQQYCHFLFKE
jgi:hypothetical protein